MPSPITIRHGVTRPFAVRVQAGDSGVDLSAVTAVTLRVSQGPKQIGNWVATIDGQTATELNASYTVTETGCPGRGQYEVLPLLTVSGQDWPEMTEIFHLMIQ